MKLEIGKRYVRRDGEITAPLVLCGSDMFPFLDSKTEFTYRQNGMYNYSVDDYDLLAEVKEDKYLELRITQLEKEIETLKQQLKTKTNE